MRRPAYAGLVTTVLLTGFEPFAGDASNPSGDAVLLVKEQWEGSEGLVVDVLPVTFEGAAARIRHLIAEHRPDVVIATGLAGNRDAIGVERIAVNLTDARIPDNDGVQPVDAPSVAGAQPAIFATLPVKAIVRDILAEGIPAEVSHSAGTFVCNHVFFAALDEIGPTGTRVGFIHVPWDAENAPMDAAYLTLDEIADALRIAVRTTLDERDDLPILGGAVS